MRHVAVLLPLLLASSTHLGAQDSAGSSRQLGDAAQRARAARVSQAPALDGRDDDAAWRTAPLIDGFLEYEPDEGAETRFRTEARVAYDDRNLYILVRMYDPAPDSMVALLSRRDVRTNSEQVKVVIDSYHDRRTAYQFAVNPAGVKRDFYVYNDVIEDPSWDAVWDVAAGMDSLGWTAEFSIPFSQLRFADRAEHTFGLMIVRDVARTGERISWPLFRRNRHGYVSQAGEITGLTAIPSPRRLELAPYVLAADETEQRSAVDFGRGQRITAGMDVKYGVTSNITLDATVNPDFGQVEADPAVFNLGTTETFRSERRPFFLEGTGIFTFDIHCGDIDGDCSGLFYSRRIGRAPQLRGAFGDYASPTTTTILGAAKLTGRLPSGLSLGILDAVTQREEGTLGRSIEPRANYLAARLQQDLRAGQTGIGAMVTAVNRSLDEHASPLLHRQAYAGGLDVRHWFLDRRFQISGYVAGSMVRGSTAAITRTQLDGVHNYLRPDDDLEVDGTLDELTGTAMRVAIAKFGGGITRFQSVYQRFSPGFEINDIGYLGRADEQMLRHWFSFQLNTPTAAYRRMFLNFNQITRWTADGLRTQVGANFNGHMELPNTWWVHAGIDGDLAASHDDRVARGGPAVRTSPNLEFWGGIEGDRRRVLTPTLFAGFWRGDESRSHGAWIEPSLELRASSRFRLTLGPRLSRTRDDNQWVRNFIPADDTEPSYTFARMRQTTVSMTTRLDYTHSPTLSFQLYAQPFMSSGTYTDWRELADPRAESYVDRYQPYPGDPGGFDYKELRSNAVVRWEYRPGSALFVVWSHGREQYVPQAAEFRFGEDSRELFGLHPDNRFIVKFSYWVNP